MIWVFEGSRSISQTARGFEWRSRARAERGHAWSATNRMFGSGAFSSSFYFFSITRSRASASYGSYCSK